MGCQIAHHIDSGASDESRVSVSTHHAGLFHLSRLSVIRPSQQSDCGLLSPYPIKTTLWHSLVSTLLRHHTPKMYRTVALSDLHAC